MLMSQTSLPQRLVQWLDTNFTAVDGPGASQELSALELVRTLEGYGLLIRSRHPSEVRQLQTSIDEWTWAMRAQVTGLLRRVDQGPLTTINRLLKEFIETCQRQPDAEALRQEGATVGKLLEAEQSRIQSIQKGIDDGPGSKREQLRDLLDVPERWKARLTKLAQSLKSQAIEVHAWQVISNVASDLDLERRNVLAPALHTQSLLRFSQLLTEARTLIGGDMEPDAAITDSLDCRTLPATVRRIVNRRTVNIAGHSETFRRLPATEAEACLNKMLANIAHNKVLSAGLSGVLFGAFAYVASLRLFVPFMLLMCMFLCIAGSWVAALHADQRRTWHYVSIVIRPLLICAALGWLLYGWGNPEVALVWMERCVAWAFIGAVSVLICLAIVGKSDGLKPDDKVQLLIVSSLRVCARPLGSLLVLAVIGMLLVN